MDAKALAAKLARFPEPPDGSIVGWANPNDPLEGVIVRDDKAFATAGYDEENWCEAGNNLDEPMGWSAWLQSMGDAEPFLLVPTPFPTGQAS